MAGQDGGSAPFSTAFRQSRNGMLLVDARRAVVDANDAFLRLIGRGRREVVGAPVWRLVLHGPQASPEEWAAALAAGRFSGRTELMRAGGVAVGVQWGASVEVVTGRRLVLFVCLTTSRWGGRFRREVDPDGPSAALSEREVEVIRLMTKGSSGPEIADELGISHDTVRTDLRNAMMKLGARSRAHLVAKALADGLALG